MNEKVLYEEPLFSPVKIHSLEEGRKLANKEWIVIRTGKTKGEIKDKNGKVIREIEIRSTDCYTKESGLQHEGNENDE